MKLLAVNGSPRRHMNTGSLLEKIVEGAASAGAEAELAHLRDLMDAGNPSRHGHNGCCGGHGHDKHHEPGKHGKGHHGHGGHHHGDDKKENGHTSREAGAAIGLAGGAPAGDEPSWRGGFRGCISCFHCKDPNGKSYGRCILKDTLTPLLQKAHEADVLVLGSPFYFSMETALMRAFMERLWFQYYLYSAKKPPLSPRKKATALVYTMNVKEEDMKAYGKDAVVNVSKGVMERLFAPCEVFLCCDTKQFKDYSRYEADYFDVPAKLKRHEEVFPKELEAAFALGVRLVK